MSQQFGGGAVDVQRPDEQCLRDLRAVLTQLEATSWAEPIRGWLRTRYKQAYSARLYAMYAAASRP